MYSTSLSEFSLFPSNIYPSSKHSTHHPLIYLLTPLFLTISTLTVPYTLSRTKLTYHLASLLEILHRFLLNFLLHACLPFFTCLLHSCISFLLCSSFLRSSLPIQMHSCSYVRFSVFSCNPAILFYFFPALLHSFSTFLQHFRIPFFILFYTPRFPFNFSPTLLSLFCTFFLHFRIAFLLLTSFFYSTVGFIILNFEVFHHSDHCQIEN